MVERFGYNVIGIESEGQKAIDAILSKNPNVILMDIQLKDSINGIEVIKRIRKMSVEAAVIFVSGSSDFEHQAREFDCIDFLKKPVSQEELRKAFDKIPE